ncbi:helix-turn-helix transcriptional regulator [Arthrobacter sp. RIT-PI-e]|uniref:helix-turn-helix transcriptional regulator n=1 Tax=Arthrobacter sp. RIT-PI-e TaxID=1681197 RepID=UPI0006767B67|nr:helix-turn-helix domain-containing protein [Arthrobacter sp. RIT-PI-e]
MMLSAPARTAGGLPDTSLLMGVVREAPVPLWVIGPTGAVVLANRAALAFLGYRGESDVVGGPSHELLHRCHVDGSAYPAHECPIVGAAGAGAGTSEWFVTRDGDPREVSWSTRGIDDVGSTLLSFAASAPGTTRSVAEAPRHDAVRVPVPARSREAARAGLYIVMRRRFTDPLFSVAELAAEAHLSTRSVQTLFQDVGRSPAAEIRRLRLDHARSMLERGHSVQVTCFSSGYADPGSFTRAFRLRFGCAPTQIRRSAEQDVRAARVTASV